MGRIFDVNHDFFCEKSIFLGIKSGAHEKSRALPPGFFVQRDVERLTPC
jgi:hypothetical protein